MARISRIEIHDLFGTVNACFSAGTVMVLSGGNGVGKSSILLALLQIFAGGHDPAIRRRTEGGERPFVEKGWAKITLDSGTTVMMTVSEKRTIYEITDVNGLAVPETPRKFIEQLGSSMAVDPGKILSTDATTAAGRKALLAAILDAMPITFEPADLPELCRQSEPIDLEQFEKIRKSIEETRRRVGVEARDGEGTLKELAKSLPETTEEKDWAAERDVLESDRRALEKSESDRIAGVAHDAGVERETARKQAADGERKLRENFQLAIAARGMAMEKSLAAIEHLEHAAIDEIRQDLKPKRDEIVAALAEAKEKAAQQERTKGAKETIERMRVKTREKNLEYERLSRAMEALDRARKAKLEALPVQGLEFDGDSVLVDGVEWRNVNRARLGSIAYQISALQAGDLPFLILDDTEHLDRGSWQGVIDAAVAGGFQVLAARVSESGGPLKIETDVPNLEAS